MSKTEQIVSTAMKLLGLILKPCPSGCFEVIRVKDLSNFALNSDYSPWMYAFMNKDKKLYAMTFNTLEDLRQALLDADTIVFGHPGDPSCCKPNPLFEKSDEEILMLVDVGKLPG